jgi:flagellar biosynthetic protein FlhB
MAENDFDRTETATPRRREDARQEGNVARSPDLAAACVLLAGIVLLHAYGLKFVSAANLSLQSIIGYDFASNPTRPDDLKTLTAYTLRLAIETAGPVVLCLTAVGVLVTVCQVGFRITPQAVQPRWSKLSPISGLANLLNLRAAVRLIMSVAKVAVIAAVALWGVSSDLNQITTLSQLDAIPILAVVSNIIYGLALKLAAVLIVLAILDFLYQYWQREQDLRMSKQEVKDEMRRMEGDPILKQRRARVARQLAMQRIAAAVPKADVVVTNPTHYALALRYDSKTMKSPKLLAKGADLMAMRIRQLAALHGIPIVERKELAQALFKSVEVGQEIPPQFYNAVAEILAYVYRLSGKKTA